MGFRQQPKQASATQEKKKPVASWQYPSAGGIIEVAVWENVVNGDNGERLTHFVTFQRSFKQGNDWKQTQSVFPRDIPLLQYALGKAFDWLMNEEQRK